jgi:hypothetical protein
MTLYNISGIDEQILSECSAKTKMLFGFAAAFIFMFVIACGFSCYYFVSFITQIVPLLLLVSLSFTYIIANLYVFNYSNISWHFSTANSISILEKPAVSTSIIRLAFMCFIIMLISKPVEMYLFRKGIEKEIVIQKQNDFKEAETFAETQYQNTISSYTSQKLALDRQLDSVNISLKNALNFDYAYLIKSKNDINKKILDLQNTYDVLITEANDTKSKNIESAKKNIEDNSYLATTILILHKKYPITWLITILFTIYFLLPIIWRCFIKIGNTEYETIKLTLINHSIIEDYLDFKLQYENTFKERYGVSVLFPERYIDPPFNTKLKTSTEVILSKGSLFDYINNSKKEIDVIT